MKPSSPDIFHLVKALSEKEVELVRKNAFLYKKRGKHALHQLFDLLLSASDYDAKQLESEIKNLAQRKRQLWDKIMRVLQTYEEDIEMVKIRRKLDFIHILFKKQLFIQVLPLLKEVKAWAVKHQQFYYHGLILQYESAMAYHHAQKNFNKYTNEIRENILRNARAIYKTAHAYEFYIRVTTEYKSSSIQRRSTELDKIEALTRDEIFTLSLEDMPLQTISYYLDSKMMAWSRLREYDKCYQVLEIMKEAYQKNKVWTLAEYANLRNSLSYRMQLHQAAGKFTEWEKDLAQFEHLANTYFPNDVVTQSMYHLNKGWYNHKLKRLTSEDDLVITELRTHCKIRKAGDPENENVKEMEVLLTLIYFDLGNYNTAQEYAKDFFNGNVETVDRGFREFMESFYLLILMCHNKPALLQKHLPLYEGWLAKQKGDYSFEQAMLRLFKGYLTAKWEKGKVKEALKQYDNDLDYLIESQNATFKDILTIYDFRIWSKRMLMELL